MDRLYARMSVIVHEQLLLNAKKTLPVSCRGKATETGLIRTDAAMHLVEKVVF